MLLRNKNFFIYVFILLIVALSLFILFKTERKITGLVVEKIQKEEVDPSIVLRLTFDDPKDPWKDYSAYNHNFSAQDNVKWADKNVCKWYGCADFTANTRGQQNAIDYLKTISKWSNMDGISIMFWVYHTVGSTIRGGTSQGYFMMSNNSDEFWRDTNVHQLSSFGFGMTPRLEAEKGIVTDTEGSANNLQDGQWYHFFISYSAKDGNLYVWRNGVLKVNSTQPFGHLNYTQGSGVWIGRLDSIDMQGYLDEFTVWNRANFTSDEVLNFYNSQRLGTPPTLDLYVKDIKYTLPFDWNARNHPLVNGDIAITFTIANAGSADANNFDYNFILDDKSLCNGKIKLNSLSEANATCTWKSSYGFHKGQIYIDTEDKIEEDNENNNVQRVYIPFINRPYLQLAYDEWINNYLPYAQNKSNLVANNHYLWAKSYGAMGSCSEGYSGNSVEPYGEFARQAAYGCLVNDYNADICNKALQSLKCWSNRTLDTFSNVQNVQELIHISEALDLIFPYLKKDDFDYIVPRLHEICQHVTNLPNTRPDLDDDLIIKGDNGAGFGAGMGGFCTQLLGLYSENPTLMQKLSDQYWGKNIPDEWIDREISYLRSYKNDAWAKYQEHWHYKRSSQVHMLENFFFYKRFGIVPQLSDYNSALCAMAREILTDTLDFNYDGKDLRNDQSRTFRGIQAGDSFSYENPAPDTFIGYSILTYYGLLCDDKATKQALLWLRNYTYKSDTKSQNSYLDMFLYKNLYDEINGNIGSPNDVMPKVIFDNANDILTIRTNYSYQNDNVIEIDGGEEKGSGHSQAQGYYLYALGEPFLDYGQVPYNDDVRAETWKNGISLQNDVQTVEGQSSFYSAQCGNARLNQYYGMQDCPVPKYPDNYPNYRQFPLEYGGDLEDYVGTNDARFAGVYVWRPYKNADPIKEYFVKFGDLLAKRTIVSNNKEGKGIYHNFINIFDEFQETRNGNDLTFTRSNKNLDINLIYSTQPFTLGGGNSGLAYCFSKTSCSGTSRGKGTYRRTYLYTEANDVDFILAHQWYYTGKKQTIAPLTSGGDKGLQQGNNIIIFDTNNDGKTKYNDKEATGWAITFNDDAQEIGAFNTNSIKIGSLDLFQSDLPISVHIKRSSKQILLTVNTMKRDKYIDFPKKAKVTIDAQELVNNNDFAITKDDSGKVQKISESGTKVTFEVESGQNSDYYTITGSGIDTTAPTVLSAQNESTTNESSYIKVQTNEEANLTVFWGYSPSKNKLINVATNSSYLTTSTILLSQLMPDSTIYYSTVSCDLSGNCASNGPNNFQTIVVGSNPPNSKLSIDRFQPSDSDIKRNITTEIIFNITASNPKNDFLTLQWFVNGTLNTTNNNLSYVFNRIGIYNIIAIVSDGKRNVSQVWIITIINDAEQEKNDTKEQAKPAILKFGWSPPTLRTDIFWKTNDSSDTKIEYGKTSSLGNVKYNSKGEYDHLASLTNLSLATLYHFKITSCNSAGCDSSELLNFTTVEINASKYDGITTDFSKLDFDNITKLVLEKRRFGKIEFKGHINITRAIDLDSYTNISSSKLFVDTSKIPELNVSAIITFYNLSLTNPRILRDGIPCLDSICKIINKTNSTITFNVTGFSEYTVEETPQADSSASASTTGSSGGSGGSSSSGGGSGGGGFSYVCNYEWQCANWSICSNNNQTRKCDFIKIAQHAQASECPTANSPPIAVQACKFNHLETKKQDVINFSVSVNVSIPEGYKKIKAGNILKAEISLSGFGTDENVELNATYLFADAQNNSFCKEKEIINLNKEINFTKSFKIPADLKKGNYHITVNISYEAGSAQSISDFQVTGNLKSAWNKLTARVTSIDKLNSKFGLKSLIIVAMILSSFVIMFFVSKRFERETEKPAPAGFSIDELELYKYVVKELNKGFAASRIKKVLLNAGWKSETVDKVINAALRR